MLANAAWLVLPGRAAAAEAQAQGNSETAGGCAVRLGEVTVATLDNVPMVTLSANGAPVTLVLDTGAERTILTPEAARRVGAETPRIEFGRTMQGIAGTMATREVELRSFTAGGMPLPWSRVLVGPVATARVFSIPFDGLLGVDVLAHFSLDIDLANHRMAFYQRQSCPPEWTKQYPTISAGLSRGQHLFFPVELDGRRVTAFLDTGSQKSLLKAEAARALGVPAATLAQEPSVTARGATADVVKSYLHSFSRLVVGGEVILHPQILVGNISLREEDMMLGVDYIHFRRAWLSYDSFQVVVSREHK